MYDETDDYNPEELASRIMDGIDNGSLPERPEPGQSFFNLTSRQGNPLANLTSGQGGSISGPVNPYQRHPDDPNREDPLFTAMAGRSGKFVGGIPEEVWNSMSQEERDRQVHGTEADKDKVGLAAGTVGAVAGGVAGGIMGNLIVPGAGGVVGEMIGTYQGGERASKQAKEWLEKRTPPTPVSREELRREFEAAKYRD